MRFPTLLVFFLVFFVAAPIVFADTWRLPKEETICSKNNRFCLKVIPKKLNSQLEYFKDKVDGKKNAGADRKVKKNLCRGIFSVRDANGILRKRWEVNLVNEVAPVSVVVSDRGDYVVTFDNWHSVGYGDDIVAIYETGSGKLIKKLALTDFLTEQDVHELPASVSSIWWGGEHFIDKEKSQLVLQVAKNGRRPGQENAEFFPIRIELSSGRVLDEVKDRFPSLKYQILDKPESVGVADEILPLEFKNCIDENESNLVKSEELLSRAKVKSLPLYPPAARAVRATGQITTGVVVSRDGNVVCATSVTGHPLLKAAVTNAAKEWKFEPHTTAVHGFITFEGNWFLIAPDGTMVDRSSN